MFHNSRIIAWLMVEWISEHLLYISKYTDPGHWNYWVTFTERYYSQFWLYFWTCWQNPNGNEISLTITNHWEPMPTVITLFTAHLLQSHSFRHSPFIRKKNNGPLTKRDTQNWGWQKLRGKILCRCPEWYLSEKTLKNKMVFIWQMRKENKMILWEGVCGGEGSNTY